MNGKRRYGTYIQGILFSHKKKKKTRFAVTWMNLGIIIPSKVSQTEKDKYMVSITCGI